MKRRWVWLYRVTYPGQHGCWFGTCRKWAAEPLSDGGVLTRQRHLVIGNVTEGCVVCGGAHLLLRPAELWNN